MDKDPFDELREISQVAIVRLIKIELFKARQSGQIIPDVVFDIIEEVEIKNGIYEEIEISELIKLKSN